jgi:hypothetical protein
MKTIKIFLQTFINFFKRFHNQKKYNIEIKIEKTDTPKIKKLIYTKRTD